MMKSVLANKTSPFTVHHVIYQSQAQKSPSYHTVHGKWVPSSLPMLQNKLALKYEAWLRGVMDRRGRQIQDGKECNV